MENSEQTSQKEWSFSTVQEAITAAEENITLSAKPFDVSEDPVLEGYLACSMWHLFRLMQSERGMKYHAEELRPLRDDIARYDEHIQSLKITYPRHKERLQELKEKLEELITWVAAKLGATHDPEHGDECIENYVREAERQLYFDARFLVGDIDHHDLIPKKLKVSLRPKVLDLISRFRACGQNWVLK